MRFPPRILRPKILRPTVAVAFCALLSLGVLAPYLSERVYYNGDLWNFLGGVVEARNALGEGQFPIRVAPNQLDGDRYPVFQFYANLPYTLCAALMGDGRNPYAAWKWIMFAALLLGGLCTYRLARRWTRSLPAALGAAAVFLSAPYLMTDLNDRGAIAEAIAICLLPAALLATWNCLVRPGWWRIAACGVAWTALGLTHNITYLYGATFTAIFIGSFLRLHKRFIRRIGRLAFAGVIHAMLFAWYVGPQFAVMNDLGISQGLITPRGSHTLVPLSVLLSPVVSTPDVSTIPRLGLQVGWLVLLSVVGAMVFVFSRRHKRRLKPHPTQEQAISSQSAGSCGFRIERVRVRRGVAVRLLLLWAIAFFMAWQPIDFWNVLPKPFYFVQFSYRLLGFTLLLGALLGAFALAGLTGRRRQWIGFAVVLLAASATFAIYYPTEAQHAPRGAHRWINDKPVVGGLGDYVVRPQPPQPLPAGMALINVEQSRKQFRQAGKSTAFKIPLEQPARVVLPVFWYPKLLRVSVSGQPTTYGVEGKHVALDLPKGAHDVTVQFAGLDWANALGVVGVAIALAMLIRSAQLRIRRTRQP